MICELHERNQRAPSTNVTPTENLVAPLAVGIHPEGAQGRAQRGAEGGANRRAKGGGPALQILLSAYVSKYGDPANIAFPLSLHLDQA